MKPNTSEVDRLKSLLAYDAETGAFTWLEPRGGQACGSPAGCRNRNGYIEITVHRRIHKAHRLAWLYVHGEWPPHEIDHINGDKADNRLANLRPATRAQNVANTALRSDSASGIKGVHWSVASRKWEAQIKLKGKTRHLGLFTNIEEAADAYRCAATECFGDYARTEGGRL